MLEELRRHDADRRPLPPRAEGLPGRSPTVVERAQAAGLVHAVVVGLMQKPGDFGHALEAARAHPDFLSPTIGVHPHDAAVATAGGLGHAGARSPRCPRWSPSARRASTTSTITRRARCRPTALPPPVPAREAGEQAAGGARARRARRLRANPRGERACARA